ncbi:MULTISPECIES: helix-turn-helix domain-containing protein [unclassified Bradyrhizobium]|uniref:helix-turn-helix domain-containing protein n=1 Tax=Bradyrhizobium sp. USDA 4541 TaxID=2817704 RepID=UPI0020A348C5|nr:helix-turn-helix transcriptional regulator [Bradyrhizobium sp. USDA 4541]MCP1854488.1 transcriptional regulator with XRE-family HTH domain [Bradyrhizobium sp. USDA 4541]
MSYSSEELIRTVRAKRTQEHMSQRALAVRSGLTQAHISQIETGRLEPGLSSFIQMVRALDLEIVLVPKKLLPAVEGILRSNANDFSLEEGLSDLFAKAERLVARQKKRHGSSVPLDRIAEYFRFLKQVHLSKNDLALISDVVDTLRSYHSEPIRKPVLENSAGVLQDLRNRIAHKVEAPRPAYALDDEDDDA